MSDDSKIFDPMASDEFEPRASTRRGDCPCCGTSLYLEVEIKRLRHDCPELFRVACRCGICGPLSIDQELARQNWDRYIGAG